MEKFSIDNAPQFEKHYNEDSLWAKLKKYAARWGEKLLYPAMMLYCMMKSPDVSFKDKTIIAGALGYLILPLDAMPDFIPLFGIVDDISALMLTLKTLNKNLTQEIRDEARRETDRLLKHI